MESFDECTHLKGRMCASIWVTTLWVMSFLFVCACYAKNTMCEIPRSILIIFGFTVTEVIGYGKVSEIIVSLSLTTTVLRTLTRRKRSAAATAYAAPNRSAMRPTTTRYGCAVREQEGREEPPIDSFTHDVYL